MTAVRTILMSMVLMICSSVQAGQMCTHTAAPNVRPGALPDLRRAPASVRSAPDDYFARFKYGITNALDLLKAASGKPLGESPAAYALLEDLGYWVITRESGPFQLTPELERQLKAQYEYLNQAFRYDAGDHVWVLAESPELRPYGIGQVNPRAQIRSVHRSGSTEFYIVDVLVDGAAKMKQMQGKLYNGRTGNIVYYGDDYALEKRTLVYTRSELDAVNSPSSSHPVDDAGEKIDWAGDQLWREKLGQFKTEQATRLQQAGERFLIDWTAPADSVFQRQYRLLLDVFNGFKMNRNVPAFTGQGIGRRAAGGGVCFDQALVLAYAIQGVGQPLGLKAVNLNGTTVNPQGGHGFVRVEVKTEPRKVIFDRALGYPDSSRTIYPGYEIRANNFIMISDPGWADYGVTPEQFARMPMTEALNPLPVDANRAVNGRAPSRLLSEVSARAGATGPLSAGAPQLVTSIPVAERAALAEAILKAIEAGEVDPVESALKTRKFSLSPNCAATLQNAKGGK